MKEKYKVGDNNYSIKSYGKNKKNYLATNNANKNQSLPMLYKKRKFLSLKINTLEKKIIFTSSKSLQTLCYNLKEQDIEILCQINKALLSLK